MKPFLRPRIWAALLVAVTVVAGFAFPSHARFRGNLFDFESRVEEIAARIQVHTDGTLTVIETITVSIGEGRNVYGISRDILTRFEDDTGEAIQADLDVVEVLRNGTPEPYRLRDRRDYTEIEIGPNGNSVPPGTHRYTLTYKTDRRIKFGERFAELTWNVTGFGWQGGIPRASAIVELPPGARFQDATAVTGPRGKSGNAYRKWQSIGRVMNFATTQLLGSGEGLTVTVSWPKGVIAGPTGEQRRRQFGRDNVSVLVGFAGALMLGAFYLIAWFLVGRSSGEQTVVPLFAPPAGLSPAAMRFIRRVEVDGKTLATALLSMAVKGFLRITQGASGVYTLKTTGVDDKALSPGERRVAEMIFERSESASLTGETDERFRWAFGALKEGLRSDLEHRYVRGNRGVLIAGGALTLLAIGAVIAATPRAENVENLIFNVLSLSLGASVLGILMLSAWRHRNTLVRLITIVALFPFAIIELNAILEVGRDARTAVVAVLLLFILINALFFGLMKAWSIKGRKMAAEIEGFRIYLAAAEVERMNLLDPPDRAPEPVAGTPAEVVQRPSNNYLPYVLAFDLGHEWADNFAGAVNAALVDKDTDTGYDFGD